MIITDLNYLEATNEEIFGGRGINQNSNFTLNKTVVANVNETITKTLVTNLGGLTGNVAQVIATSDASGGNANFTSIISGTQVENGVAESFVQSVAASR